MTVPRAVSVVIPVYNRPVMVAEAIESVIAQTGWALQIVVVDDCSTDSTPEVIRAMVANGYPVTFTEHQHNRGVAASRNTALGLTTMSLVGFLDSDDLLRPGSLDAFLHLLERPGCDIAWGMREDIDVCGGSPAMVQARRVPSDAACLSGMVMATHVIDETGPFDEDLRVGSDIAWLSNIPNFAQRACLYPQVTLDRRLAEDNLTADAELLRRSRLAWVRKRLSQTDRR